MALINKNTKILVSHPLFFVFKRTSSFVLFGRAFKNAKKDFWVSIQVLFWITIVLALLFWWEERKAQPDAYGGILGLLQSFVWSITRYIGDPGHFADVPPVTLTGRSVDTAIGILKILIFAVPAGLVANGFMKAINDEKHRIHLDCIPAGPEGQMAAECQISLRLRRISHQ